MNVAPSRARRQLAVRLAQRQKETTDIESLDPDAADPIALETSEELPIEPLSNLPDLDLSAPTERELQEAGLPGLQISGLRLHGSSQAASQATAVDRFSGFGSGLDSDSDSDARSSSSSASAEDSEDDDDDEMEIEQRRRQQYREDFATNDSPRKGRRPSTTEAKYRIPLDEDEGAAAAAATADRGVSRSGMATEGEAESPFADPVELSEDSTDDSSDEGDVVEIRPRRISSLD